MITACRKGHFNDPEELLFDGEFTCDATNVETLATDVVNADDVDEPSRLSKHKIGVNAADKVSLITANLFSLLTGLFSLLIVSVCTLLRMQIRH